LLIGHHLNINLKGVTLLRLLPKGWGLLFHKERSDGPHCLLSLLAKGVLGKSRKAARLQLDTKSRAETRGAQEKQQKSKTEAKKRTSEAREQQESSIDTHKQRNNKQRE
jgi:hypothetical protein